MQVKIQMMKATCLKMLAFSCLTSVVCPSSDLYYGCRKSSYDFERKSILGARHGAWCLLFVAGRPLTAGSASALRSRMTALQLFFPSLRFLEHCANSEFLAGATSAGEEYVLVTISMTTSMTNEENKCSSLLGPRILGGRFFLFCVQCWKLRP